MAEGLPTVLVENAELVGTIAVIITSSLYRYLGGEWPLLRGFRRKTLPFLHEVIMKPAGGYAAREQRPSEHVGKYDLTLKELHKKFRSHKKIYPNNFASIKYKEYINDNSKVVRQYESSSWAHRVNGITGDTQTHLMVYENDDGTVDVYAHYELNPIPTPILHYEGSDDIWSVEKGVSNAKTILKDIEGARIVAEIGN